MIRTRLLDTGPRRGWARLDHRRPLPRLGDFDPPDWPRTNVVARSAARDPLRHPSRAPRPHAGTDLRLNATSVRAQLALGQWARTAEGREACHRRQ